MAEGLSAAAEFWHAIIVFMASHSEIALSPAIEDYAKAIYALERRNDPLDSAPAAAGQRTVVSTNSLAERLGVTPGSASAMAKRLGELGLVTHVPYRGVSLTEAGRRVALEVIRHHRLLELYLVESLGLPWDQVHAEAEVLEHVLSERLEQVIAAQLGNPTRDPHGDPIPGPDLQLIEDETCSLQTLSPGARGTFRRVSDADPEMLRYLAARGIAPGDECEVVERQPFGGPVFVRFSRPGIPGASRPHPLGGELARAMRVELTPAAAHPLR